MEETSLEFILRILAAAGLGALIGLERDIHGRPAGLRTHLLVSAGAATFTVISAIVARQVGSGDRPSFADPGRIAAQVIAGIGFLGAGSIIKEGFAVRGLTTAACLWVVAAIGMACGTGEYTIAVAVTMISLLCLVVLKYLEHALAHDSYRTLTLVTENGLEISKIVKTIERTNVTVNQVAFTRNYETGQTRTQLSLRLRHRGLTDKLAEETVRLLEQADVPLRSVQWDSRA